MEQAALLQLATAFWLSQAVYVAAKLNLADLLAGGPKSCGELADAAGAHPEALYRVLRALASAGIFAEDEHRKFRSTPRSRYLESRAPGSLRAFAILQGEPESWQSWGQLLYSVQTGKPAFDRVFGMPQFRYLAEHPQAARQFDDAMASRNAAEAAAVLAAVDLSGAACCVDVGGGNGALLAEILRAYPRLQGVLLELPHVAERARAAWGGTEEGRRCRFAAGDFFEQVPPDGDLYLLKKVIHDWDDEHAGRVLRRCRAAIAPQGRLLLVELIVPAGNGPSFAKLLDLLMLIWPGGKERTEEQHRQLLGEAGFRLARVIPTASPASVIEALPV